MVRSIVGAVCCLNCYQAWPIPDPEAFLKQQVETLDKALKEVGF